MSTYFEQFKSCVHACAQYALRGLPYLATGLAVGAAVLAGVAVRHDCPKCPYCPGTPIMLDKVLNQARYTNTALFDIRNGLGELRNRKITTHL